MEWSIGWVLGLYLAASLGVGLASRRRKPDELEYFLASRKLGAWRIGGSLAATVLSGSSFLAGTALVYGRGLIGTWYNLTGAIALIMLGALLAGRVRSAACYTLPELLERHYGAAVGRSASTVVVAVELGWLALLIRASGAVIEPFVSFAPEPLMAGILAVLLLYTMAAGQRGVVATDLLQLVVILVGLLVLAWSCAGAAWAELARSAPARRSFPLAPGFGLGDLIAWFAILGLPHLVGSDVYARLLAAQDSRAARAGAILAGLIKLAAAAAIGLFGLAAANLLPAVANPDHTLPLLIRRLLQPPLDLLLLVALLAVIMSTASTVLLTAATVVARDLLRPAAGAEMVRTARRSMPVLALAAGAIAAAYGQVLPIVLLAYTVFAAGLSLPVLSCFLPERWRPRASAVGWAILGGALAALAAQPAWGERAVLIGLTLSLVVLAPASIRAVRTAAGR
jgi:SSS family solute:Na+ symporter